jgi:glycine/D-amino acid oxidase-like deaminating enzyme
MGAGYTGLWTALSLVEQSPTTTVLILEKEIAGFGASGRNGGWVSALFPASTNALIHRHGVHPATAMRQGDGGLCALGGCVGIEARHRL